MTAKEQKCTLGNVTIWGPTTSNARCSIFEALAELFGVETSSEAVQRLRTFWRASAKGPLDIDYEAGAVSIRASRSAIVNVAALVDQLATPEHRNLSCSAAGRRPWTHPGGR